ncbi:MAG: Methionine synthase [Candidatus Celerinatantimonas neptuna]|nr:MAG: Methionine synthase [Candidatus Celerinatantimonas neptuna]
MLSKEYKSAYAQKIKKEYEIVREQYARKRTRGAPVTLEQACENALTLGWNNYKPVRPEQLGMQTITDASMSTLREYIDWTPFSMTWSLAGKYPRILDGGSG